MPDLAFGVEKAEAVPYAAAPMLAFQLRINNADPAETIHTVVLRCQIQLEVARRRYTAREQEQLRDLFGDAERWGQTLRSMLWTHASAVVPSFTGSSMPWSPYFRVAEAGDIAELHEQARCAMQQR